MVDESGGERCVKGKMAGRGKEERAILLFERESRRQLGLGRGQGPAGRLTPPASNMTLVWLWNWSILVHVGERAREHERVNLLKLPSCLPTIEDNTYPLHLADSSTEIIAQPTYESVHLCMQ
jgi:hypothetical protein